jgi:hypothetical protein
MKNDGYKTFAFAAGVAGGAALSVYLLAVRPWHMRWGATDAEVRRAMAGDDLVPNPIHLTTRALTIRAERTDVWPWLVQMGYGRGGMYSYDFVDRVMGILDRESTWQIIPEYQQLKAGDVIPMGSGPSWPVAALDPCRSMVLHIQEPGVHVTWSYLLEGLGWRRTRLVLRVRTWLEVKPPMLPLLAVMDPGEFLMVRRHLLGVKERAEALAGRPARHS